MEALVPAFLVAVLTQLGDRPAWLTAILADRFGRPLLVALAAGLGHAAGNALAVLGALWIAPMLTPEARALLLAVALLYGGLFALVPERAPERLDTWRLGPLLVPLLGIFILAFGERTQFLTFAIGARSMPWFAAVGAAFGALAVAFVAAALGERAWRRIPFRGFRVLTGLLFLVAGAIVGLGALRLL